MTSVISTRRQATLLHDLTLELCLSWPLLAVKGTYTGVYRRNFFKGVSTTRFFFKVFFGQNAKKNLARAPAVGFEIINSGLEKDEMS